MVIFKGHLSANFNRTMKLHLLSQVGTRFGNPQNPFIKHQPVRLLIFVKLDFY